MTNNYKIVLNKLLELTPINETDIVLVEHENYKYIYNEKIESLICNNDEVAYDIGRILQENLVSKGDTDFEFYEDSQELYKTLNDRDYSNKISNSTKFSKGNNLVKSFAKNTKKFKSDINDNIKVVA